MACVITALVTWQLTRQKIHTPVVRPLESWNFWIPLAMGSSATILMQWMYRRFCRKSCHTPDGRPGRTSGILDEPRHTRGGPRERGWSALYGTPPID